MNLIIDQGNSRIKMAVFSEGRMVRKYNCTPDSLSDELRFVKQEHTGLTAGLLSTVGGFPDKERESLQASMHFLELDHKTPVPFSSSYTTPRTLGVDRIGLVAAAVKHYPEQDVLVIDCGTCITYDMVTAKALHKGGAIAPGIRMRYEAMNTFTARLPRLQPTDTFEVLGKSTADCMHSGVLSAVLFEVEGYVKSLKSSYPDLTVVITGGDAHFLRDNLKSDIFAHSNFLLEGLNHILDYNIGTC